LKDETARNTQRVFERHLPLRLLGVSLVVAGLVTSLVGHLQSIQSDHHEVVVTTTEVVVTTDVVTTTGPELPKSFTWFAPSSMLCTPV